MVRLKFTLCKYFCIASRHWAEKDGRERKEREREETLFNNRSFTSLDA